MNRSQALIVVLLAVTTVAVFVIVVPFLEYVLAAVILAYVLYPLHVRLSRRLAVIRLSRRVTASISALCILLTSVVAIIVPMLYVTRILLADVRAIARGDTDLRTDIIEARIEELTGEEVAIEDAIVGIGDWAFTVLFGDIPSLMFVLLELSLGIALVLFLVFYLLRDGAAFVAWLRETSPLSPTVSATLVDQIDRTTWGAVIGHAFAAVVQALVAGGGLYLAGVPNVVFWTMVMAILAFLPLIGVFLIWAPAAGYLYLVGEVGSAVFLAVYGLTVVSMIDYYARPLVIDQQARLNPAVILVGVFGGIFTLGFVGLFVGPILIGILVAILETIRTEFDGPIQPQGASVGRRPTTGATEERSSG